MFNPFRWLLIFCALGTLVRADFAKDLARIHTEATGGRARIDALKAYKATGVTKDENGTALRFAMWTARPNRIRTQIASGDRTIVQGWDGVGDPWTADSQSKRITFMAGVSAADFKNDAEFDDPLIAGPERKVSVDYSGEIEAGGRTLLKLVVTQNFTSTSFVYLDPTTYLIVRRDIVKRARDGEVVWRTEFADFRPVAGVLLPFRVTVFQGAKQIRETVIDTIEPNPELPAGVFSRPPANLK